MIKINGREVRSPLARAVIYIVLLPILAVIGAIIFGLLLPIIFVVLIPVVIVLAAFALAMQGEKRK